jgi:hypothetical protein
MCWPSTATPTVPVAQPEMLMKFCWTPLPSRLARLISGLSPFAQ